MSIKNGICDRCGEKTSSFRVSFFNLDECCFKCIGLEQKHPDYKKAKEIEYQELLKKNYNFKGIGLPENYNSWCNENK